MLVFFRLSTMMLFLFSLFALIIPVVVMFAQENLSEWHGYIYMGLKSVPDGVWGLVLDSNKYPDWLTLLYWVLLIGAIFLAWRPKQNANAHG